MRGRGLAFVLTFLVGAGAGALLLCVVSRLTHKEARPPSRWVRALCAPCPGGFNDPLEYGWFVPWSDPTLPCSPPVVVCVRYIGNQPPLFVCTAETPPRVEMRVAEDWNEAWLVDRETREVLCSLDYVTESFRNRDGAVVPLFSQLSLADQAKLRPTAHDAKNPQPDWATPDGGVLVAMMPP